MKRLFSNKSGFTLAEIIIAIAIFSIMMAMIMQMLQLSIAQRNENLKYAKSLNQQQDALVVNGKDTSLLPEDTTFDGKVNLSFKKDPTDGSETPLDIGMDYVIKPADPDAEDINNGLNYFVGNFDYSADGVGGGGGGGSGNGIGQAAKYDTRLTGTKGMKNINISVSKNPTLPAGVALSSGQVAYEISVSADCSDMLPDDKPDAQIRMYFYSSTSYHSEQVDIKKKTTNPDGKEVEEVVDTYYKKVYDEAKIAKVIQLGDKTVWDDAINTFDAKQISNNGVKVGVKNGYGENGINKTIKFIVIFNGDPQITAASFGKGGSGGTYNTSSVYEIQKNNTSGKYESVTKIGKSHTNIYGSYPYEVSDKPIK